MRQVKLAITMGDVAGIGPEVIVRACCDKGLRSQCRPYVVGHPGVLQRAADLLELPVTVEPVAAFDYCSYPNDVIPCWNPGGDDVADVQPGRLDARAGRAAYESLIAATRAALDHRVDAVVTAPLNKAALHLAGHHYPGHTEILAEVCQVDRFAMMLYLPPGERIVSPHGFGVAHVTLHTSIASVPGLLSIPRVCEKITLLDRFLRDLGCAGPRLALCALNPHAGEAGLFGDEEKIVLEPAVVSTRETGIDVVGPYPADTLLRRAIDGEFDGVVAIYHDQGHIALKLIGLDRAVNVTLGLPIVRTSPSHGTAFDVAWQGVASADGMRAAIGVAIQLAVQRKHEPLQPSR